MAVTCTHLRLATLVSSKDHAEDEPVERDDVVLPDEVVDGLDGLRHESRPARLAELEDEELAEGAEVGDEVLVSYALQHPESAWCSLATDISAMRQPRIAFHSWTSSEAADWDL